MGYHSCLWLDFVSRRICRHRYSRHGPAGASNQRGPGRWVCAPVIRLDIMDGVDGGCAVGGGPGFVGIPPYLVRQAQVPFPGEFIPPALLSPRLPERSGPQPPPECPQRPPRMGVEAFQALSRGGGGGGLPKTPGNRRSDALLRSRTGEGVPPSVNYKLEMRQKSGCRPAQMGRIKLALTPL